MMQLLRTIRPLWIVSLVLGLAGCTSGGCASGCGGIYALPDGFAPDRRVENAAAVRLTDSGMAFLEQNLGPIVANAMGTGADGVLAFPVPSSEGSFSVLSLPLVSYTICPDGPDPSSTPPSCLAEIDLAGAQLQFDTEDPHNVRATGPLPVRIQSLPVDLLWLIVPSVTEVAIDQGGVCAPAAQQFADINLDVSVSIEIDADPAHARYGYSRVRIAELTLDEAQLGAAIHFCDPGGQDVDEAILNGLKDVMIPTLTESIVGTLVTQIETLLCRQTDPSLDPPCPTGTYDVDGVCRYGNNDEAECATMLLGLDGQLDLASLLGGFSPGTQGAFDFVFATGGHSERPGDPGQHWGDLDPIAGGATLGMYGGTEARPPSACVPLANAQPPSGIPIPAAMTGNSISGWPSGMAGPHFGMAVSERFMNYSLAQIYDAGALCLGIPGDKISQLNSRLIALGLGAPSMEELGRQRASQPLAVVVRPHGPPRITVGNGTNVETDPLLRVQADELSFDFYVWSLDRYVRAMTATADLNVPANLDVGPDGLHPVVEAVGLENVVVTNTALLREDPALIAATLQTLVGDLVGSLLGSALPAFDINAPLASFGMRLVIPPSVEGQGSPGLRRLTEGNDAYLGIFAALELASTARSEPVDTDVEVIDIDPGLGQSRADCGPETELGALEKPRALLRLRSDAAGLAPLEWQVRVDGQLWRPFHTDRFVELEGQWLLTEGRHAIEARARRVGDAASVDPSPATLDLRVDYTAPTLRVDVLRNDTIALSATDTVSDTAALLVRWRLGQQEADAVAWQPWSEWTAGSKLEPVPRGEADWLEAEAQDEEGRVGQVSHALIRGVPSDPAAGCQCALGGGRRSNPSAHWAALAGWAALLGAAVMRRRPRRPVVAAAAAKAAARLRAAAAVVAVLSAAGSSAGCSCAEEQTEVGCRARGDCRALTPGLIGAYSSAVVATDGTLWVAGYLEADWLNEYRWGDLVVGRYDGANVAWQLVDGIPSDPPVDVEYYDVGGFRGGQTEPGDDVGLWTSVAVDAAGNPAVAYYDATHRSLRYASMQGGAWTHTQVEQRDFGDLGRYAKLLFIGDRPVISYLFIEPGDAGAVRSGVRVATGSEVSAAGAQWSFEEVVSNPATPCRAAFCAPGTQCGITTGRCVPSSSACPEACLDTEECVDVDGQPQCDTIWGSTRLETFPAAMGLYISAVLHPGGDLALGFYDRIRGNVHISSRTAGAWSTLLVDGESGGVDTGDRGVGLSLAIDGNGSYHLAYVDGITEQLLYAFVHNGTEPTTAELVDDGYSVAGQAFADRKHIVGDDSSIVVTPSGDIRISYQDATDGTLRIALGTPVTGGHFWDTRVVAQAGFAGAFSKQVVVNGTAMIVNWWRVATPSAQGDVRVVFTP